MCSSDLACEAHRRRGGPWALTYALGSNGVPTLRIEHSRILPDGPVTIAFPGETSPRSDLPITAIFSVPITNRMPFGPVLFVDTSSLPGTVALACFGHVVEMVSRTLFVDLHEVPWTSGTNIVADPGNKPSAEKLAVRSQDWMTHQATRRQPRRPLQSGTTNASPAGTR